VGAELVGWVANRPTMPTWRDGTGFDAAGGNGDLPGGLRIPPVRLDDAVAAILIASSCYQPSVPATSTRSAAQTASASNACGRLEALHSPEPLDEIVDYGERRMRALAALPDGEWRFEDVSTPPAHARHSSRRRGLR
jgi:hypothetical protein